MSKTSESHNPQYDEKELQPLKGIQTQPFSMESDYEPKNLNEKDVQFDDAGIFSRLFCLWVMPYYKNTLAWWSNMKNMFRLPHIMETEQKLKILEKHWAEEMKKPNPNFWKALSKTYFRDLFSIFLPKLIDTSLMLIISLIIGRMIEIINGEGEDWEGYCLVLALFTWQIYIATSHNYNFLKGFLIAGAMRGTTLRLLYKHALKLQSSLTAGSTATGKLVAVAATDTELFDFFLIVVFLPLGPLVFIVALIILFVTFGVAGLIGAALILFYMICMYALGYFQYKLRMKIGRGTDQKLKIINSIIEGIRVVKMYAWEFAYEKIIQKRRYTEIKNEAKNSALMACHFGTMLWGFGPVLFVIFYSYIAFGNELTPAKAFTGVSVVYATMSQCVGLGAAGANFLMILGGACARLGNVLKLGKRDPDYCIKTFETGVKLENFSAAWKLPDQEVPETEVNGQKLRHQRTSVDMTYDTLSSLNLEVKQGELAVIVGPVGSGKSSLLSAILGEMIKTNGTISINGNFAYVEQEPWIRSASVRDNIIMDNHFDEDRYDQVVGVCSLLHDFNALTDGDSTMIGDRGGNLSGGQKARISLARAVYADADVYLLDDPLSAVDVQVRVDLFERCICDFLSNKTRILVTHQLHVVNNVEKIVWIDKGIIFATGSYSELQQNEDFIEVMGKISDQHQEEKKTKSLKREFTKLPTIIQQDKKTILAEEHAIGSVPFSIYVKYWKTGGCGWFLALMVLFAVTQVLYLSVPFWVSLWASSDTQDDFFYAWMLLVLGGSLLVLGILRMLLLYLFLLKWNYNLHSQLLKSVVRAPVKFFDSNPIGRILNRFAKDTLVLDAMLRMTQADAIQLLFMMIANTIVIMIVNPYSICAGVPLIIVIYFLHNKCVPASREARRNELISKSPIFSDYASSIKGLTTLRAYGYESWLSQNMEGYINDNMRSLFTFQATIRTFQYYTDICAAFFIGINALVIMATKDNFSPETAGISLSFTASFVVNMVWLMKQIVDQGNFMTSAERVVHYCDLKSEANIKTDKNLTITDGKVEFRDLSMKYRQHLDYALCRLDITVKAGSKVGIVGRTGSGKSSILQVLFRLVEANKGQILIDDQDISEIGLHDFRKQISVIPQDPFIFADTVSKNLDPFDEYSREQLWSALEAVELRQFFEELPEQIETVLEAGDIGLSAGQKQLMCLARAILRNNKILILDEATANIDMPTDKLIQEKIREQFSDCTVLTIAHRIDTIIDADKVIVMDNGECVQYASPKKLLNDPESYLSHMVDALGEVDALKLREKAQ